MASITKQIYPQMVWRDRQKKLWNPIHKKTLKNLPEERVRLRVIEALIQAGWSKHRISTEESIGALGDTSMRTDIICYNQEFEPRLLVECKAEHISISGKTAEQVARYNQKVGAPFLMMTNGMSDYWYAIDGDKDKKITELDGHPSIIDDPQRPEYTLDDWQSRGFMGSKASPDLRSWYKELLPGLWLDRQADIRFLSFSSGPSDVNLNHYYNITSVGDSRRLALTTINTAYGGNRMIVILNENDENRAVLEINLDLLFEEKKGNGSIYSRQGIRTFDVAQYINLLEIASPSEIIERVDQLFAEHVD
ncbi:MAG: type I restriction enzyme HsdR N-terminal domain-containing protein [Fodinibius sp.]|nr:type I restriction enzyme HsdR N-terminal domain-containing protein [Fodinibius sp.]